MVNTHSDAIIIIISKCNNSCILQNDNTVTVVFARDAAGSTVVVIKRIIPDHAHWQTVLAKLTTFWRHCILPEILGRWYTRKCHLSLTQFLGVKADSVCYCQQEKSGEETVTCCYKDCTIKVFHCSCIAVSKQSVPTLGTAQLAVPSLRISEGKARPRM